MSDVIEVVSDLVKALLPGGFPFLLLGLTIGVVLLFARKPWRRRGRAWLVALVVMYGLLSMPWVAGGLEGLLASGYQPLQRASDAGASQLVVVLTGGGVTLRSGDRAHDILSRASIFRMMEAERLYGLLGGPELLVSGGPAGGVPEGNPEAEAMASELVRRGIPASRVEVEATSPDTHEQAVRVGERLRARGADSFVLVTSAQHMRRALSTFRGEGMSPIPSAAIEPPPDGFPLMPSSDALDRSYHAIREIVALAYYAGRGWLR